MKSLNITIENNTNFTLPSLEIVRNNLTLTIDTVHSIIKRYIFITIKQETSVILLITITVPLY